MSEVRDMRLMIEAGQPVIVIESRDEARVVKLIGELALTKHSMAMQWTCTDGLKRLGFGLEPKENDDEDYSDPEDALEYIKKDTGGGCIYILCDIDPYFERSPKLERQIKDVALAYERLGHTLVLLGHSIRIPASIQHLCAKLEMRMPTDQELLTIIREEARHWQRNNGAEKVRTERRALNQLIQNLKGLSFSEARRLARGAIVNDGAITEEDVPDVSRAKFELMGMDAVLSYEYDTAQFAEVGGLSGLKTWIQRRRNVFHQTDDEKALAPPKGVMLLGVQGSGKSLAAKATAGLLGSPLLRLDFGALFNKYVGESEKNMREALQLAEMMAPCVLWMDEIEKGMSQEGQDNGTSKRLLGTLLTWMAENDEAVFVVATSNDVSQLPPELLRKGRLDEIFFVDLPSSSVREDIFTIHLNKRDLDPGRFDLSQLAEMSDGFSGAEIEQAVVAALYHSHAEDRPVTTDLISHELSNTQPLSVVKGESIDALRDWARDRAVWAD